MTVTMHYLFVSSLSSISCYFDTLILLIGVLRAKHLYVVGHFDVSVHDEGTRLIQFNLYSWNILLLVELFYAFIVF